jgi:hypothetical protein
MSCRTRCWCGRSSQYHHFPAMCQTGTIGDFDYGNTFAAKAIHLDTRAPEAASRVVIIPNLQAETKSLRSSTLSLMEAWSMFFSLYGSAGLLPVSAFEKDILDVYGLIL